MMEITRENFNTNAGEVAFDREHYRKIRYNIEKYNAAVHRGRSFYSDLELARTRAGFYKYQSVNELEKYLKEFESRFEARGGKVIWALDTADAVKQIHSILDRFDVRRLVKSKSMITEEIGLNEFLVSRNIEPVETDLGEFIVQTAGQKPYHIVTPAMHMSREDVSTLFNEKFGLEPHSSPEAVTAFVRDHLREKFYEAGAGISGANFLIADTGSVALTENEGNALLTTSLPQIHIVVAGIEKIIPSVRQLDLFWPLLATNGTGQFLTVYNTILSGPRQDGESDGPNEMFVILLDNGRTKLLAKEKQRQALTCIHCGACLNACPVYQNIGGHAYGTVYSGPIGSVITPYLQGIKEYNHLSFASTLCGKCTEVCPVKIPLHELLLYNRNDAVKEGHTTSGWRNAMKMSRLLFLNRWMLDKANPTLKKTLLKKFMAKAWGKHRKLPVIAKRSFKSQWMDQHNPKG